MALLATYPHLIWWCELSSNSCDAAVDMILAKYQSESFVEPMYDSMSHLLLRKLCANTNHRILPLLQQHMHEMDKDCWAILYGNPIIYQYYDYHLHQLFGITDYRPFLHERMVASGLASELMANRFHPRHMDKWASWGHEEEDDFL